MITITIVKNKSSQYTGFKCLGHAGFAKYGEDIVCAAVSVLVINTIHSMETLLDELFHCSQDEDDGRIELQFDRTPSKSAVLLLDSMVLGLKEIKKQYGKKYIILKFEEV